ncbi:20295_t:CDS:2, partial [Funneliformis geosporum]
ILVREVDTQIRGATLELEMNKINDKKLILNVEGVKYETFWSTLITHPSTLLGIIKKAQHGRSGSLTNERATKKQQLDTPDFSIPINDNKTEKDILKETEMEVDPVPSTSNDKGKQPEIPIPPVENYGEDESFDITENLLGTNGNTNIINFA